MRLEAILFDMDGTLVDTFPDFIQVIQGLRVAHGLPPVAESSVLAVISAGARGMLEASFSIDPSSDEFEALRQEFLRSYQENCAIHSRLFDGLEPLLGDIESAGLRWGVVTNKPLRFAEPLLRRLGLAERCAVLICPDHVKNSKPDPEPVLLACSRLAVQPGAALFVGDDLRDVQAGQAAGSRTVAAAYGYINPQDNPRNWGADAVVDDPRALRVLLDRSLCRC